MGGLMGDRKKGLLVLDKPVALLNFIDYYYSSDANEFDWSVYLHHYASDLNDSLSTACRKSGLFSEILESGLDSPAEFDGKEKVKLMLGMLGAAISGRKDEFAEGMVCRYLTKEDVYDRVVLYSDLAIICGCLMWKAASRETIVMEEGLHDYLPRTAFCGFKYLLNVNEVASMLVAKMGFGSTSLSPWHRYKLDNLKYCTKIASIPERLLYRDYASIQGINLQSCAGAKELIERTFSISSEAIPRFDVLLVTDPLRDWFSPQESEMFNERLISFFVKKYPHCTICLKRHPRDDYGYDFGEINVVEIDKNLPLELVIDYTEIGCAVLTGISSSLLRLNARNVPFEIVGLDGAVSEEYRKSLSNFTWLTQDHLRLL